MTAVVPPEVEKLMMDELVVAHLATCRDGRPHSAPLWYRYDGGALEILTTGVKLANIRANPNVAVSIQQDDRGVPEWMVTIQGTATVVEDDVEIAEANRRMNRKYGVGEESWSENVLVRIDIESVSHRTY